jgi:sulfhydrogenase subunit beta (sulfur reductase)
MHFLPDENLHSLLSSLQNEYTVYLPEKKNNNLYYAHYLKNKNNYTLDEVRACEPLKAFFFRARQRISENFQSSLPPVSAKPLCIMGVKACDLKAFKVQDHVFLTDEYTDPFYQRMRTENVIIAADCSLALDTCFCMALGIKPYPEDNFDLNLTRIEKGYLFNIGSEKGEAIVKSNEKYFASVPANAETQKQRIRKQVQKQVQKNIEKYNVPQETAYKDRIRKNYKYAFWNQDAKTCVECGACNTICPTCHCFLLYDQGDEKKMARFRVWDSCMIKDFARVAGGANPRPELWMRLRNRFEKKFDFFPKVLGINACTGCGRCILACPAKIDIRKVLGRLAANG